MYEKKCLIYALHANSKRLRDKQGEKINATCTVNGAKYENCQHLMWSKMFDGWKQLIDGRRVLICVTRLV